ncbi:arginyl-tRNA synthetase [Amylocarpus encephaloides]|uniref:arginine--tRNA ligase n=1 Tax=Amylocarpus encephaloides TaxID=45428 RepID=A0A9P7YGZ0_9HELO|nr:arginyl-tRNA synthetase [Amylocarpus encephaloides]
MPSADPPPVGVMENLALKLKSIGLEVIPRFPGAFPATSPVDIYRAHIADKVGHITGVKPTIVHDAIQWTQTLDKGDCLLPIPALRIRGKMLDEVARSIESQFSSIFLQARRTHPTRPAFNSGTRSRYGHNPSHGLHHPSDSSSGRKKIIMEFGSPNIAKPFHAGHLRSTIIGGFLANLYEHSGWEVPRMNYLGDWGKQYGVLAVGFNQFGSAEALERDPVGHLFDVYVNARAEERQVTELEAEAATIQAVSVDERARQYFKLMCEGDNEALGLWKKFRDLSIIKYKATFARLNIHVDEYAGESQIKKSSMEEAAQILEEKGLSEASQGAVLVDLTQYSKKLGKAIVRKRGGTSIYLTRDIGAVFERYDKYHYDKMIYVIVAQQDLHMAQLFKLIEVMGRKDLADKLQHINFGMVAGMSTRKGTVMKTNETKYQQIEDPEKTADTLAISAILVQDMTGKRINGYTFDMDRMTSFEGDTGPYLQYAHARVCSIVRKTGVDPSKLGHADFTLLTEKHAIDLVRMLAQWPDVFQNTYKTQEPVTVLTYLFKMTHALSSSYDHLNILKSEPNLKNARLALYSSARHVIHNGMALLGLSPLERM